MTKAAFRGAAPGEFNPTGKFETDYPMAVVSMKSPHHSGILRSARQ